MAKNLNKKGQTHDQLQAACFRWACNMYHPYVFRHLISIPNDAARGNVVAAKHLQAIGVTSGVWDMPFFWIDYIPNDAGPDRIIPAVYWWEFKVGVDTLSTNQIKFRDAMQPFGHTFNIAQEEEEFQTQFKSIVEPTLDYIKSINASANKSNIKVI